MLIISWNIQAAKGVDGKVDVERIAKVIKGLGDADVICLQEVLHDIDETETSLQEVPPSQAELLAEFFPQHREIFGAAIDRQSASGRSLFGNMILSRLPVLNVFMHKLPQPADPDNLNMPRQAIEVLLQTGEEVVRVVTTHLDFFSVKQRQAQVEYLCALQHEFDQRYHLPSPAGSKAYQSAPETNKTVFCGDFNLPVASEQYQQITTAATGLQDAWRLVHGEKEHDATCGIYDHEQWAEGPHCRDFFFVSDALSGQVTGLLVDVETAASDHQPFRLDLSVGNQNS